MRREDFTYESNAYGYMLYYKGKPMGGVSTATRHQKHWRHMRADLKEFKKLALLEINSLLKIGGQARLEIIQKINKLME